MKLDKKQLEELKDISTVAAKQAGQTILYYKKNGFDIYNKNSGTSLASQVLTEVDILCQNQILDLLTPFIEQYDLGLLTEEEDDNLTRLEKEYFVSIDPMDGTKSFIDSLEGFSVSISLVSREGRSVLGVIYDPVKDNLYYAIKDEGLFKNGHRWTPKYRSADNKLKILVDPSFKKEIIDNVVFVEYGGAVLNSIEVLEGRVDCYIKKPKINIGGGSIWDFSGTVALFNECGAIAEDLFGNPIQLNNPETTFMNGSGVLFCKNKTMKLRILEALNINI